MGQYTSYYLYEKYERRCSGSSSSDCSDWIPSYPNTYSKDGDSTMPLVVRIENDVDCGWHCLPEFQWVDVPIEDDYICDDCELDIEFRWVSTSAYTYFGDYKYEVQKEQFRKDGGEWQDTENTRYYNTGIVVDKKIKITMYNGDVFFQSCGTDDGVWHSFNYSTDPYEAEEFEQSSTNTFDINRNKFVLPDSLSSGWSLTPYIKKIEFGECVHQIGWRHNNSTDGCGKSYWDDDKSTNGENMKDTFPQSFNNTGVEEIVFPSGLTWIGISSTGTYYTGTFGYNRLRSITLPSSVETIGCVRDWDSQSPNSSCRSTAGGTFEYNEMLTEVNLNEGLKSIGRSVFEGCTALKEIEIPSSLEKLGHDVFKNCSNLRHIVFKGSTPPEMICNTDSTYYDITCNDNTNLSARTDTLIYVPCGSISAYTDFLVDIPASNIKEYGGACGSIPALTDEYFTLATYRIGNTTKSVLGVYKLDKEDYYIPSASSADFSTQIIDYADEITLMNNTAYVDIKPKCDKLTVKGCGSIYVTGCKEVVIETNGIDQYDRNNLNIYGGFNGGTWQTSDNYHLAGNASATEKVTFNEGYSPLLRFDFNDLTSLKEVHIDGNPVFSGMVFTHCFNLGDVYISYSGGVISLEDESDADRQPFKYSYPTVHVPCALYDSYKNHPRWGDNTRFRLVVDDPECSSYTTG